MHVTLLATSLFALIGGPSVGKTSIINALREEGEIICVEAATDVILAEQAAGRPTPWDDEGFEIKLFNEKVQREGRAREIAFDAGNPSVFIDGSILDSIIYLEMLNKQDSYEAEYIYEKLIELNAQERYKAIFYVEPHSGSNFELTKTAVRREDTAESLRIANKLKALYATTNLPIISVPPHMTPKERALFILKKAHELSS